MNRPLTEISTQQKLANSREKLLDAMGYVPMTSNIDGQPMLGKTAAARPGHAQRISGQFSARLAEFAPVRWLQSWWQHHPAHAVVDLGRPYLETYAQRHPGKLVAMSAGVGAVLWLVKPWRLLSTAAIVSLVVKTGAKEAIKAGFRR